MGTYTQTGMPTDTAHTAAPARPETRSHTTYWWRRRSDVCPISLEAIRRLRVEPFNLPADEVHETLFCGDVLAQYLIGSGAFLHPISRRPLTRDDCVRLDAHLLSHKQALGSVTAAFDEAQKPASERLKQQQQR